VIFAFLTIMAEFLGTLDLITVSARAWRRSAFSPSWSSLC